MKFSNNTNATQSLKNSKVLLLALPLVGLNFIVFSFRSCDKNIAHVSAVRGGDRLNKILMTLSYFC